MYKARVVLHRNWNIKYQRSFASLNLSEKFISSKYENSTAIVDGGDNSKPITYRDLNILSSKLAANLARKLSCQHGSVGALNKSSVSFVVSMLATWKLGKIFVPLCYTHSLNELSYIINDSKIEIICCSEKAMLHPQLLEQCDLKIVETKEILEAGNNERYTDYLLDTESVSSDSGALVVYTSGTTGRPKGVLHTHNSLYHMVSSLVSAWNYNDRDKILHFLPLYHVHGLINKLLCVLYAGGTVEFMSSASAPLIWKRLAEEELQYQNQFRSLETSSTPYQFKPLTLFMAVPTIYARLLEETNSMNVLSFSQDAPPLQLAVQALSRMRLMACGSAALPDSVLNRWEVLTGYRLLERYGMTEIGMALSNPYQGGAAARKPGTVGKPLPYVSCRLVDNDNNDEEITDFSKPGELRIKGPNVFKHYLNRPDATAETFDSHGWFKTGDIAQLDADGYYKILGRNSTDIIKSAGYKLSALEIERELLAHPQILEAAVIGVPDETLGEVVTAVISLRNNSSSDDNFKNINSSSDSITDYFINISALHNMNKQRHNNSITSKDTVNDDQHHYHHPVRDALRVFLKDRLAYYKQPKEVIVVDQIPRNHLGKVNKKQLLLEVVASLNKK